MDQSSREFLDLLALLVLGCVIAAAVQTWLPRSWLLAVGEAPTGSILALMLLAVVVSASCVSSADCRLGVKPVPDCCRCRRARRTIASRRRATSITVGAVVGDIVRNAN